MSKLVCACVDDIFKGYDYNNKVKINLLKNHTNRENAWILIDKDVYSIRKDDNYLLDLFNNYYGKNIKDILMKLSEKERILILEKLNKRKIGQIE